MEVEAMAVEVMRERAGALTRDARVRKWSEVVGGGLSIAALEALAVTASTTLLAVAAVLLSLGEALVLVKTWEKSSPGEAPGAGTSTAAFTAYYRAELERERALLWTSWAWYLGPVAPGLVLLPFGVAQALGWSLAWVGAVWGVSLVVVWAIVVLAHRWKARRLGREIEALASA